MKIRFTNTRFDLFFAQWHLIGQNKGLRILLPVLAIFIIYSSYTYDKIASQGFAYKTIYAFTYLIFALGIAFVAGIATVALNVFFMKGKGVLGEHTLEITEEGLIEETDFNRSFNKWSSVMKTKLTKNFYFIFITDHMAHVIPRSRPY